MRRTPITVDTAQFPAEVRPLLTGAAVYDSSCSPEARVWFVDKDGGYYLKTAPAGTLDKEAAMGRFFHKKALGPAVLLYVRDARDWLLTERAPGEDCTHAQYLAEPERLCDTTAALLRRLHETDTADCPVPQRTADYLATAAHNYRHGLYDTSLFPDNWGYASADEAWSEIERHSHLLATDTLLHGDYCLPNVLLDNWRFGGFIDLGNGGVGDRHIDLFWGAWTLFFNLKTDKYCARFLDAYGRDAVDTDMLRLVAACEVFG